MFDPTKVVRRKSTGAPRRRWRARILAGMAVLAISLLLLNWGLSAMQWTTLTNYFNPNSNDVERTVSSFHLDWHSFPFSNPLGNDWTFTIRISFQDTLNTDQCYTIYMIPNVICTESLPMPTSSPSTATEDYVIFIVTDNASSPPIQVSFTGPQGRLNVTGYFPPDYVYLQPYGSQPVSTQQSFQTPTLGDYSAHIMTQTCPTAHPCSTTNATGSVTTFLSIILYNRPYYNAGLATVIVGGVSIAAAMAFLAITSYRTLMERRRAYRQQRQLPETPSSSAQV